MAPPVEEKSNANKPKEDKRVEYKVVRLPGPAGPRLEDQLNAQGAGGWLLCSMIFEPHHQQDAPFVCIFYRLIEEESDEAKSRRPLTPR